MRKGSRLLEGWLALGLVVAAVVGGCGGGSSADCTSLCTAAQAGNCTSITGDCGKFCAALVVVDPEANCTTSYDAYESCLGSPSTVCTSSCNSQESALSNCVISYCGGHITESSCVTLASSF